MDKIFKIFHQASWQVLGKVATSLSTIVILSLITRNFGEAGTGTFTLSLTYLAFFTLAADLGLNAYLLPRFFQNNPEQIFRKTLGLRLILALFLIAVSIMGVFFWPQTHTQFKQIVLVGALFAILQPAVFVTTNLIFQKNLAYEFSVKAAVLGSAVTLAGAIFVTGKALPLTYLMLAYILGWITILLSSLSFVNRFIHNLAPVFDFKFIKETLINSWPISVTLLLNVVYFRLDSFLLSFFRPISEVGIYNLAYQIFQTILVLPTFVMNSFFPMMLQSFSQNKPKFLKELKLSLAAMFVLSVVSAVVAVLMAPLFISIITGGKGFSGSSQSLQVLSLGFPAFFISSVLMWTFVTLKKYKLMLLVYLIGLVFNFSGNILFIPQYSFYAAAAVTVGSEYLILVLQLIILIPQLSKTSR